MILLQPRPVLRRARLTAALFFVVFQSLVAGTPLHVTAAVCSQLPPTGHEIASQFRQFYDTHGGLATFGYATSDARTENGYLVQWTERQRLEWHPEYAGTASEVLLGLLGRELTRGQDGPTFRARAAKSPASRADQYFAATGQTVTEPFISYWQAHGGLPVFGYPISAQFTDDNGMQVQWFERARFELHPEMPVEFRVLLGHLGLESAAMRAEKFYQLDIAAAPVPEGKLSIDVAQGGESDDPGFFSNVRELGSGLGPGLVRLDNIYNFYHIVQRGPGGVISYNWSEFDRMIDGVLGMGKEPMICLSYMPETLSASGSSRVVPPVNYDEWGNLVKATVEHVNVARNLGVKYWEVWNEPNEWSFWQASYPDYLKLYDVTVAAVRLADPTALVGGPALSRYSAGHL
ncbi:MAG TPA: hypothetical protein VM409_06845, partial [Chloroflexia bacterium]|nr:hypothetical protein [Chloroflexia bacterium]